MEKKSQHYIPQIYLREFLDKSIINTKWTPTVHIFESYDSKIKYLRQKAPENICEETNYYSLNDENEMDRVLIENALHETENNYGKIIRKIIGGLEQEISFEERCQLSEFISFMFFRVPLKEEVIKRFVTDSYKIILDICTSSKDIFISEMRKSNIAMDKTDNQLEHLRKIYRDNIFNVNITKGYINGLRFTACEEVATAIYYMKWDFLIGNGNKKFITSDNPVCLYDRYSDRHPGFMSSQTVEMYFPISPIICLRGIHIGDNSSIGKINIPDNDVLGINSLIIKRSNNYVFSSESKIEWLNGEAKRDFVYPFR